MSPVKSLENGPAVQFRTLTHLLAEAIQRGDDQDVAALLGRREEILTAWEEQGPPPDAEWTAETNAMEAELVRSRSRARSEVRKALTGSQRVRQGLESYRQAI